MKKFLFFLIFIIIILIGIKFVLLPFFESCSQSSIISKEEKYTEKNPKETVESGLLIGRYTKRISLPLNKYVEVGYIIPVDKRNQPLTGSENMVFYAVFNGEHRQIPCSQSWLKDMAKKYGCTIFSIAIKANIDVIGNPKQYYIYPEAGWFEVIFEIQKNLEQRFKFPHRKLFLTGVSSGGSMVQRLTVAYPEHIAGVAWCGGTSYNIEHQKKDDIPRLILNTWGCSGENASKKLTDKLKQLGNTVFYAQMPPNSQLKRWYRHAPSTTSYKLMESFLGSLFVNQNAKNKNYLNNIDSKNFEMRWKNRFQILKKDNSSNIYIATPLLNNPKEIAVLFYQEKNDATTYVLDALYYLHKKNIQPILIKLGDELLSERKNVAKIFKQVFHEKKWENLSVTFIGFESAGMLVAVEALNNPNSRIKQIILYSTPIDCPFQELSIVENRNKSNIKMIICQNFQEEILLPNTIIRKFSYHDATNHSWRAEIEHVMQK